MKKIKRLGVCMLVTVLLVELFALPQSGVKVSAKMSRSTAVESVQKYLDRNINDILYYRGGYGYFTDIDMDGNIEFVIGTAGGTMGNYPKEFYKISSNGKLKSIGYTDAHYVHLYYNKKTKKYVYLTNGDYREGYSEGYGEVCELVKSNGKLKEKKIFSYTYKYNYNRTKKTTVYYVNNKKVSKSTYNKSKDAYMRKLTKVKVSIKTIDLESWKKYSKTKKNSLLTNSYKAFSYKK